MNAYTLRLQQAQEHMDRVNDALKPLQGQKRVLKAQIAEFESRIFIEKHGIKREMVVMAHESGFTACVIYEFIAWMKKNTPHATWAEWNGIIYRTSDLFEDRMPDMPGRSEHL